MNVLNELKNWMIENNDDDTPLHPSDIYKKIDELVASKPSGGKSAEEILATLRGEGKYYHCVDYENALKAMKEYKDQYAHQQPIP